MLAVVRIASPSRKRELFGDFDPRGHTWVVSDLQSKWHLQKELLARDGILEQACVMRATELWRQLSFQMYPDVRILSPELAQTLFWTWIQPMNLPWARSPHAVPVVLNQMKMWMTILSDPRAEEIMVQWFNDNQESFVRWGHWFELCLGIWRKCHEERLMMTSWLPAMLLGGDLTRVRVDRRLTFDLGPQVSQVEGLLIKELARVADLRLLFPEAPWVGLMQSTLKPYDDILPQPYRGDPAWRPAVKKEVTFARFSTQLAEVKDAVARVRAWLDAGVKPQDVAIVAPDIETIWPALRLYLEQEGIPTCKPVTARLGSFLEVARWAAGLRTSLHQISSADLEVFVFARTDESALSFDEFRVLFTNVYDTFDLARARHVFESLAAPDPRTSITVLEFLGWALKSWTASADPRRLIELLKVIGQEVPASLKLTPPEWLGYVDGILARREVSVRGADETGVWCVSLSSADWLPVTHGIFVDLAEGSLRSFETTPVSQGEGQKIFADTGWAVGTNDRQEHEFELLWFLNRQWTELRLTFAATDFGGRVLTPSRLWMWAAFTNDQLRERAEVPAVTRWDQIQRVPLGQLARVRAIPAARMSDLDQALRREVDPAVSTWGPIADLRLSASSLKAYWECPFVFAAERRFKLSNEPALDLDLDRMKRGSLLHAIAEELCAEPLCFDHDDRALAVLVDRVRARAGIRIGDERLWPAVRAQHVRLARLFLEHERRWRERYPHTFTVGREVAFACGWDAGEGATKATNTGVTLRGRIDRVDRDRRGRLVLIDYKGSDADLVNWPAWPGRSDVQMALYASILEAGLTKIPAAPVVAANYYVIKKSERRKGFHLRDEEAELYDSTFAHKNFIDPDQKQHLFDEMRGRVTQAVTELKLGHLNPNPIDRRACASCSWRTLCRAPHLN